MQGVIMKKCYNEQVISWMYLICVLHVLKNIPLQYTTGTSILIRGNLAVTG